MTRRAVKKAIVRTLLLAVCVYVGSYLWRSLLGRYEPNGIGTAGVKWYSWAPQGFQTDFIWNTTLVKIYEPLLFLDQNLWHTNLSNEAVWNANCILYPINYGPREEIGKVYEAWGRARAARAAAP